MATSSRWRRCVRWVHPERGLISPLDFIAIAEKTGLMVPIGEFVVREACRQARAWQLARPGQPPIPVNVNLSGVQLQHPGLVAAVSLALEDSGLRARAAHARDHRERRGPRDRRRPRAGCASSRASASASRSTTSGPATRRSATCAASRSRS